MLKTRSEDVPPFNTLRFIPSSPLWVDINRAGVPFVGLQRGGPMYRAVMPPLVAPTPPVSQSRQLTAVAAFASHIEVD